MTDLDLSFEEIQLLKTNFSMSPSYIDLVTGLWHASHLYYSVIMAQNYTFSQALVKDLSGKICFEYQDLGWICFIAVFFTFFRSFFETLICQPLISRLNLNQSDEKKFPESAWKTCLYSCTWSYCLYLVRFRYDYFLHPYLIWDDWAPNLIVPFDIKLLYFLQCGFYVHSIYATVYMDSRRKDFYVMILHHVLTIALISISYATRYHKIGLLVLFMHDVTDICLESTKLMRYLTVGKDGRVHRFWDNASQTGFAIFTASWFLFRLYWFPLKVLYSTGVAAAYRMIDKDPKFYSLFNVLLWILLVLNLYWLYYILKVLFRVLLNPSPINGDVRDDDDGHPKTCNNSKPSPNNESKRKTA